MHSNILKALLSSMIRHLQVFRNYFFPLFFKFLFAFLLQNTASLTKYLKLQLYLYLRTQTTKRMSKQDYSRKIDLNLT